MSRNAPSVGRWDKDTYPKVSRLQATETGCEGKKKQSINQSNDNELLINDTKEGTPTQVVPHLPTGSKGRQEAQLTESTQLSYIYHEVQE